MAPLLPATESESSIPTTLPRLEHSLAERQPLVVASTSDNFPYGYLDEQGRWQGFAVDVLNATARVTHLRIQRVVGPGHVIYDRFRAGEFDLLQAYSETPDRHAFADFSVPILTLQGALFVRKTGSAIHSVQDLNGRTFALIGRASIGEKFLTDYHLSPRIIQVDSSEQALAMVDAGNVDATFVSQLTALSVMKQARLRNVAMLGEPFSDYDIRHCFAVHRGDAQLLARLNEGLAVLHSTGEFNDIYRRWFGRTGLPLFTQVELATYVAIAFGLGLAATTWGLMRQRVLRKRIAGQAKQLADNEALLRALYETVPVAMCVLENREGVEWVLSANPQAALFIGKPADQMPGRPLDTLVQQQPWARELLTLLARRPEPGAFIEEERTLSDHRRIIFTVVSLAGSGSTPRLCVLMEDITRRAALDEEMAQMRKLRALGELVGGIAHEFNNLLTPILVNASMIREDWPHDARLQQQVKMMAQAGNRAADLTQRLLAFGRKGQRAPEHVTIESIVEMCIALLEHTVDRRVTWENAVPPDLPPLYLNRTDLNQILINLLINARDTLLEKLEAPPPDWRPKIRISAACLPPSAHRTTSGVGFNREHREPAQGWQQLIVADNGMGMAKEVQERIFEPFYTTKEVGKGTGLGLATVWHLATSMGGRVEVESTPGQGSLFRVLLPMWPVPSNDQVTVTPSAPKVDFAPKAARFLIAEDDCDVANAVCGALRRAGHSASHVPNGRAAWSLIETDPRQVDVLVVDVNMPEMDGIELVQRARGAGYSGKVIIMSGRLTSTDMARVDACLPDCLIAKPFTADQLLQAVGQTLATSGRGQRKVVA
jgi:signal transduction histidine kinase/CheY-like chemotaxis protein